MDLSDERDGTAMDLSDERDGTAMVLSDEQIIVGIDIGYTCTGVAVGFPERVRRGEPLKLYLIQSWPGQSGRTANKVPTLVGYKAADFRAPPWGFECLSRDLGPNTRVCGLFKFLLDREHLEMVNKERRKGEEEGIESVTQWFTDFLTGVYNHILDFLEKYPFVDLDTAKVEYIFGLPTSWESNDELVEEFRKIVDKAGFGSNENSSVTMGLTEGVASAVYTAKRANYNFCKDDILLVCDAGGGTSDICMLKVLKIEGKIVELVTLEKPLFVFAGSVQIDEQFQESFEDKLNRIQREQPGLFEGFLVKDDVAREVTEGQFRNRKIGCGTEKLTTIKFRVPGLPDTSSVRVEFSKNEIEAMFDKEVGKIIEQIDKLLAHLATMKPGSKVSSFILSGGLGSSKYVQAKLEAYFNPKNIPILVDEDPDEPPLSVCKGLVLDRMQRVLHGTSVLRTRRCRASYGILQDEIYDKIRHKTQQPQKDPVDGRKYATGIRWFIKRGDTISENDPLKIVRERKAHFQNPNQSWVDTIVTSRLPPDCLPQFLGQGDSRQPLCMVKSNSAPGTLMPKRKYRIIGKKYLTGKYEMLVSVDKDDLKFETQVNGVKVGEYRTDQVLWDYTED